MRRAGNVWDNPAMESFVSTLKTERTAIKVYRTRNEARADIFDDIQRFYDPRRKHSKLGDLSPIEFEVAPCWLDLRSKKPAAAYSCS